MELFKSDEINNFFNAKGYKCIKPYKITDTPRNNETVFVTAGIQPSIDFYEKLNTNNRMKTFIAQPVLRTQYLDSLEEGSSLAFINPTTAGFNINPKDYELQIKDWYNLFKQIGLNLDRISTQRRTTNNLWGNLSLNGISIFYYYDKPGVGKVEIGDSTYYDRVESIDNESNCIKTLSDSGFGMERLRWCTLDESKSYFDIYSDTQKINSTTKGLISALGMLGVNGVIPSQKNSGYRARLFSKRLVKETNGKSLNIEEQKYLVECLKYWADWEKISLTEEKAQRIFLIIKKEFDRNCNSFLLNQLNPEQKKLVRKINVNLPRQEFIKRLASAKIYIEEER